MNKKTSDNLTDIISLATKAEIDKINNKMNLKYDAIIFTYQNNIPNISKVMEQIVLSKKITVIYINNTINIGHLYNLVDDYYFHMTEESKIEVLLPYIIKTISKYVRRISILEGELAEVSDNLNTFKLTNKAKRKLMDEGFSEEESHKFIINKSMELRKSKKHVVNLIIENKIDI